MAKTNFDITKARNKGIAAINKIINKEYKVLQIEIEKDKLLLQTEKNKWLTEFIEPFVVINLWDILPKEETTAKLFTDLNGHPYFPEKTLGVDRTFIVKTNLITKLTTVNVTFKTKNNLQDCFIYYFAGSENIATQKRSGVFWYDSKNDHSYYATPRKLYYKTMNNVIAISHQKVWWYRGSWVVYGNLYY